jgi:hypothetical protein
LEHPLQLAIQLILLGACLIQALAQPAPRLQHAKARLKAKDAVMQPAYEALLRDAAQALKAGPFAVTQKERTPPSGDQHDYLSLAPYWWPDPQSKDGLPYIRRDGETNPDNKRGTDANTLGALSGAVETLALAYCFTNEARYAERAALLIRVWFLAPATKMNPHLRYAQAVPGRAAGRGAGLIESRHFIPIINALGLLQGSAAWTAADQRALQAWFRDFVRWMQTSPQGQDEAQAKNNHGTWYAAQLASFALLIGDAALARETVAAVKPRIAWQIEPDGRQPAELQRTRGLWYSGFNLEALLTLAELGQGLGVDLYGYQTKDGRSIRRAIDYLAPYADAARRWPHPQINEMANARRELALVLRRAALAYQAPEYEAQLTKHLASEAAAERWQLLWPHEPH